MEKWPNIPFPVHLSGTTNVYTTRLEAAFTGSQGWPPRARRPNIRSADRRVRAVQIRARLKLSCLDRLARTRLSALLSPVLIVHPKNHREARRWADRSARQRCTSSGEANVRLRPPLRSPAKLLAKAQRFRLVHLGARAGVFQFKEGRHCWDLFLVKALWQ
jgi:hypothetical protein